MQSKITLTKWNSKAVFGVSTELQIVNPKPLQKCDHTTPLGWESDCDGHDFKVTQ